MLLSFPTAVTMSQISAFTTALHAFQVGLSDEEIEIFRLTTIEHVWDMIRYLQAEQASRMSMQNMSRLEPFINALTRYSGVIEVFVQGKPEIMAFIWVKFAYFLCSFSHSFLFLLTYFLGAFQNAIAGKTWATPC